MATIQGISTNLNAFLDMIPFSELGPQLLALSDDGYNVIVGSMPEKPILFDSYKDHPRIKVDLPHLHIISTAAGRYQVLMRYFDAYKEQLRLPDFGKVAQDKIAIQMIRECHDSKGKAIDAIERGDIDRAIFLCASRWASFPGAQYGQHTNKLGNLISYYVKAGGKLMNVNTERYA